MEQGNYKTACKCLGLRFYDGELSTEEYAQIATAIISKLFDDGKPHYSTGVKTLDYLNDYNYYYASFKQIYNIDLCKDYLRFNDFLRLFDGLFLTDKNAMTSVVEIRTSKLPENANAEQADNYYRLKNEYRLEQEEKADFKGIAALFKMAKG